MNTNDYFDAEIKLVNGQEVNFRQRNIRNVSRLQCMQYFRNVSIIVSLRIYSMQTKIEQISIDKVLNLDRKYVPN